MREGLRSGKLRCKLENGGVPSKPVVSKKRKSADRDDPVVSDSGVEKRLALVLFSPEKRESTGRDDPVVSDSGVERCLTLVTCSPEKRESAHRDDPVVSDSGVEKCLALVSCSPEKRESTDRYDPVVSDSGVEKCLTLVTCSPEKRESADKDDPIVSDSGVEKCLTLVSCSPEKQESSDRDDLFVSDSGAEKCLTLVSCSPEKRESSDRDDLVVSDSGVENCLTLVSCAPEKLEVKTRELESEGIEEKQADDDVVERKVESVAKKKLKVKKEESSDSEVQMFRRVLRSGTVRSVKPENQDVSEKETAMKSEETRDGVNKSKRKRDELEKLKQNDPKVENGGPRKKPKIKRGRPKKVQASNGISEPLKAKGNDTDSRVKLSRSCKMRKNKLKPWISDGRFKKKKVKDGRGRPKKVQKTDEKLTVDAKVEKVSSEKTLIKADTKSDTVTKKGESELGRPKKMPKRDENGTDEKLMGDVKEDKVSSEKTSNKGDNENGTILSKGESERARSTAKQAVRDKIIEILLSAGWTIQYRPRNGRVYNDSVYVNLKGRTHWSVTLAYNSLKQSYEEGGGESNYYTPGFKFIPIPDEKFGVLKKVINKRRSDKKKLSPDERKSLKNGVIREKSKPDERKRLKNGVTREKNKLMKKKKEKMKVKKTHEKSVSNHDRDRKKMQNGKRRTLLVRDSMEEADSCEGGYIPYTGQRTVFAWMIDLETVLPDSKVKYFDQTKTRVLLEGRLAREGIHCDCCEKILTISEFEAHAGDGTSGIFENMVLESGTSLSQSLLESWNKQPEPERSGFHHIDVLGDDPNDDTCGICGDGGELVCCDGCPSTFHQSCLDIQKFPSGDWHCVYCSCKYCGKAGRNDCEDEDCEKLAAPELFSCQLCEEKYHQFCTEENDAGHELFCGKKCSEINKNLENLLGVKHNLDEGFSCTFLRRSDLDACDEHQRCDVAQKIECNSKLAVALSVMDECFLPMLDQRSGINLIRNIVYNFGSNMKRLSYTGFLTAILERGDEIISAASIRIHGFKLAEMPFIGTRYMYRRQGMCRRLLTGIDSVLHSLGVDRLVIPAISQLEETWTSVFGFKYLEVSEKQEIKSMNLVVFPGVQMLQKPTFTPQISEQHMIVVQDPRNLAPEKQLSKDEVLCEADEACINDRVIQPDLHIHDDHMDITDTLISAELGTAHDNPDNKSETVKILQDSICACQDQTEEIGECRNGSSESIAAMNEPAVELDKADTPFSAELITACDDPDGKCETAMNLPDSISVCRDQTEEITECRDENPEAPEIDLTAKVSVSEEEDQLSALPCSESESLENGENGNTHEPVTEPEGSDSPAHHNPDGKTETIVKLPDSVHVFQDQTEKIGECLAPEIVSPAVVSVPEQEDELSVLLRSEPKARENGETAYNVPFGDYSGHEFPSNGGDIVQTSLTLGGIYSSSSVITEEKPEDDSRDCRFGSSHGAYLDSNGHCKSKEIISCSLGVIIDNAKD